MSGVLKTQVLSSKELFIIMVSAVIHDVDHRGVSNTYLINSKSKLAAQYNDQSVLENHHLQTTFAIMKDPSYNIMAKWTEGEKKKGRTEMIRMVLATDMSTHAALVQMLLKRSPLPTPFNFNLDSDKAAFAEIILHAADISNSVRPFRQSEYISTMLAIEFNMQAEKEKAQDLPVAAFMVQTTVVHVCKGEIGFLTHVAKPYWDALASCYSSLGHASIELPKNIKRWTDLAAMHDADPELDKTIVVPLVMQRHY